LNHLIMKDINKNISFDYLLGELLIKLEKILK